MTIYYVDSAATGANDGTSWANAWTSLASAFTNVTTAGDVVYVSHEHVETITAATTYTVHENHTENSPLNVVSVNKADNTYAAGAFVGHTTTSYAITFSAADGGGLNLHGFTLRVSGNSSTTIRFYRPVDNRATYRIYNCQFTFTGTSDLAGVVVGNTTSAAGVTAEFFDCIFTFATNGQTITAHGSQVRLFGCIYNGEATENTRVFRTVESAVLYEAIGCDFSQASSLLFVGNGWSANAKLKQCKLKLGFAYFMNDPPYANQNIELIDCHSGDVHHQYEYATGLGSIVVDTAIYANDNASGDVSWKVTATSRASRFAPFVTPWISVYHDGTSAITPYLEILRSGSSTAFTDAEVWAEWSYKGTSGSTRATIDNDGAAILATPANQTASSKTASDWTGEAATSWFGKIGPASAITPAEVGDLAFRICVGAPSTTVYVDPQIRGLS